LTVSTFDYNIHSGMEQLKILKKQEMSKGVFERKIVSKIYGSKTRYKFYSLGSYSGDCILVYFYQTTRRHMPKYIYHIHIH
jgi:hypothetical protein